MGCGWLATKDARFYQSPRFRQGLEGNVANMVYGYVIVLFEGHAMSLDVKEWMAGEWPREIGLKGGDVD